MTTKRDIEQAYQNKYRFHLDLYNTRTPPWLRSRVAQWVALWHTRLIEAGVTEERIEELEDEVNRDAQLHSRAIAEWLAADEPPRREMFEGDTEPMSTDLDTPLNYVFVPYWDGGK